MEEGPDPLGSCRDRSWPGRGRSCPAWGTDANGARLTPGVARARGRMAGPDVSGPPAARAGAGSRLASAVAHEWPSFSATVGASRSSQHRAQSPVLVSRSRRTGPVQPRLRSAVRRSWHLGHSPGLDSSNVLSGVERTGPPGGGPVRVTGRRAPGERGAYRSTGHKSTKTGNRRP